tara:strand:- start:10 stop:264 length:255 start_codon:yes stop_codon:yes gene_type:complete
MIDAKVSVGNIITMITIIASGVFFGGQYITEFEYIKNQAETAYQMTTEHESDISALKKRLNRIEDKMDEEMELLKKILRKVNEN